ncbi:hypothetical protein C0992_000286 [Termitomyces sp. T32_za158]|nr:hypothetical protein C0992_000286 [Termitomyces sp. T32_za158]
MATGLPKTPPQNWHPLPAASAGPFAPGAYYADLTPAPPTQHDPFRHLRPLAPPLARTSPSPLAHQQQVAEYVQRQNSALRGLWINPEEFARRTQVLLASLGQKHPDGSPENWAHHLLNLNDQGVVGSSQKLFAKTSSKTPSNAMNFATLSMKSTPRPIPEPSPIPLTWKGRSMSSAEPPSTLMTPPESRNGKIKKN